MILPLLLHRSDGWPAVRLASCWLACCRAAGWLAGWLVGVLGTGFCSCCICSFLFCPMADSFFRILNSACYRLQWTRILPTVVRHKLMITYLYGTLLELCGIIYYPTHSVCPFYVCVAYHSSLFARLQLYVYFYLHPSSGGSSLCGP